MQAFVLAAGKGERLLPFTRCVPKPLFHLLGQPLLGLLFDNLRGSGFRKIGLNTHHLGEQIRAFVADYQGRYPEVSITVFEEHELLGPVGALVGAKDFFTAPTLVVNSDIVTNFPFKALLEAHDQNPADATMLLHRCEPYNKVKVINDEVCGFGAQGEGLAYTGLQVVTPELVAALPEGARDLVPAYDAVLKKGLKIRAVVATSIYWRDLGTLSSYLAAHQELLLGQAVLPGISSPRRPFIYPANLPANVQFEDWVFLEEGVQVAPEARLRRVVAWQGAKIPSGAHQDTLFIPKS